MCLGKKSRCFSLFSQSLQTAAFLRTNLHKNNFTNCPQGYHYKKQRDITPNIYFVYFITAYCMLLHLLLCSEKYIFIFRFHFIICEIIFTAFLCMCLFIQCIWSNVQRFCTCKEKILCKDDLKMQKCNLLL